MGTKKPADPGGRVSAMGEPGRAQSGVVRMDSVGELVQGAFIR